MPKVKPPKSGYLRGLVAEFGGDVFSTDGMILFCKLCETKVGAEKRFHVEQHISREKHQKAATRAASNNRPSLAQQMIGAAQSTSKSSAFNKDLCEMFVSANIPLWKLNNKKVRSFLQTYTKQHIPDESTLRKNYLSQCYEDTMNRIRLIVRGKKIWVSIDETTAADGSYVANVIIGTLEEDKSGEVFLLTTEILEKSNYSTISKLFDKSMLLLWPAGIRHDDVLLFVTDAAPYMVKAAHAIKALYSKMIHVTCLAHGIHRVAEEVRGNFPNVDRLVANVKKVFLKAPSRIQCFKTQTPDLKLPPQPIITRWGTWIDASLYYCDNFNAVKSVVNSFDSDEAACIKLSQELLKERNMEGSLASIKSNFSCLPGAITCLEKSGEPLSSSIAVVRKFEVTLNRACGKVGVLAAEKFKKVLDKNVGFTTLCKILDVLNGENYSALGEIDEDLTASDIPFYKYAPIVSVDVERSFSQYKNLLADNRRSFTADNLRMTFVVHCNAASDE